MSDPGDYVLPGNASTFPVGGLHARYFNDTDLQSDSNRLVKIHAPPRTQAYSNASTVPEYQNQQDATVAAQANPTPGAASSNWSVLWFGAVYLKLSAGSYTFTITYPAHANNQAVRLWVGQTTFGTQIIDQWAFTNGSAASVTGVASASTLSGTLPYGAGSVARDGWYPIKLAYAVDATASTAPTLKFTAPSSYTDPGGTAITGASVTTVPATSLSPLGCVDQRYQGQAHFDMVQQTLNAYNYQASLEPQRLESGSFPGSLAPRIREGHDTNLILNPDDDPRKNPILNYSNNEDASDFVASLAGNGAGFQNGTTGQLQSVVYDPTTLSNSLFDVQGWQDFSDASFGSLLQALLNGQLGLRLSPWQAVSADPKGQPQLSRSWPLTAALSEMRWRPGDGLRLRARDVSIYDTSPRQILTVTRNFVPEGTTSTTVGWMNRPRNPAHTVKQLFYAATRPQRNYQRQLVSLTGNIQTSSIAATGTDTNSSAFVLLPGDLVVSASLRVVINTGATSLGVVVNGTDETSTLGGPWTVVPVNINLSAIAGPSVNNRLVVQIKNLSATTTTTVSYQVVVDLLR